MRALVQRVLRPWLILAVAAVAALTPSTATAAAQEQQAPNPTGTNRIYYGAECNPAQANGSVSMEVTWQYYGNGFRVTRLAFWNGTNHTASFGRAVRLIDNNGTVRDYYMESIPPHSYGTKYVDFTTPNRLVRAKAFEYLGGFSGFCGGSYGAELVINGL
ncbi:hypothetical protein J7E93_22845 [Streptomyces sp. ISL-36]|uniref:hypothetical protein n=1 Tax=Streptomyces sp. ISL-36 TaxID=2819182 RepID=UPI001BE70A80|nr:hypothetical protein [Streptomyces sp. ISL-36]MBT2442892.1 hypothetical protein [Streptomyces sp. ISL-36]